MHTREENLGRVERLIHTSVPAYALQQFGSSALRNAKSHPMALVGAGLAAGVVLFGMMRDRRR